MVVNKFRVLLLDVKNKKLGIRLEKDICQKKEDTIQLKQTGSYHNQEEWLEELLDDRGTFYNGSESDDSDNDDENYNENSEQQQSYEGFANSCYKIVSPILLQELINDSAVCKHCSGTFLLVEDVISSMVLETRTTYFKKEPHF